MIDIPRDREHVPFFPSRCAFFFLRVVRDKTWMRPWEMGGVRLYTHAGLHRAESHFLAKNAIQYGHGSLPPPSFVLHPFPERYPSPTLHSSIYKTFIVGRTLPGILLRRYRSDYFTWIFDLNLPTPLKFRLDPTQFSPRFSSFSLLFEREGGRAFERSSRKVELYRGQPSLCPRSTMIFFHDIVSRIYTFFSSEENRFYESQTAVKRAVEILSS